MSAPPLRTALSDTYPNPSNSIMRTGMGALWDWLTSKLGDSGSAGNRNAIHNGGFTVNQRGVASGVSLAAGAFGHDRWKAGASGCTYTYAVSAGVTTVTITAGTLIQVIDGAYLRSGNYVLSWTGTALGKIGASFLASGIIATAVGGTNMAAEFGVGTLTSVQFEPGTIPTAFEVKDERPTCQRYLPAIAMATAGTCGTGVFFSGTAFNLVVPFQVKARVAPTGVTLSTSNAFTIITAGVANICSAIAFNAASDSAAELNLTVTGTAGDAGVARATGAISILFTGAEL